MRKKFSKSLTVNHDVGRNFAPGCTVACEKRGERGDGTLSRLIHTFDVLIVVIDDEQHINIKNKKF
jgi:hypothetical protein